MKKRFFKYALARWCYQAQFPTPDALCEQAAGPLGMAVDLAPYSEWPHIDERGIGLLSVLPEMGLDDDGKALLPFVPGFNDPKHADRTYNAINTALDQASQNGIKYVLAFTGFDSGEDRFLQYQRIFEGFVKRREGASESLVEKAERINVTIVIEMLNTIADEATWKGHPGYLGDDMNELAEHVVRPINSPNFKIAFDIYHIITMEDNSIALIEELHELIGLIHVAGVMRQQDGKHPQNRGELNLPGQVVNYPLIGATLAKYLPQGTPVVFEYIPTEEDPLLVIQNLGKEVELFESQIAELVESNS